MRIVIIGPVYPYRGGISHFTTELVEKLQMAGHEVDVISFRKQYPAFLYPGKSDKDFSHERKKTDAKFILSPLKRQDWMKTLDEIQIRMPDMVIIQWWVTIWAPALSWILGRLQKMNIPVKVLVHNTYPHESSWVDKRLAFWALSKAQAYICMTQREANKLHNLLGENARVQIVAHPIYPLFPPSGLSKKEARAKLKLPEEIPIALFFGFVRPYKGLSCLIESLSILKKTGSKVQLVVAGEFWEDQNHYEEQIDRQEVRDMIHLRPGYMPDSQAALYFEAADCFVAPYISGTQSGAIKLAIGYGLPTVLTDLLADEIVKSLPENFIVIPPGEPKMLADGINEALGKSRMSKLQTANLCRMSWELFIKELLSKPG